MKRRVGIVIGFLVALAGGAALGVVLYLRQTTGEWTMPSRGDLVVIKDKLVGGSERPSRVIYMHRDGVTLTGGVDDAPRWVSSVVASTGQEKVTIPGFSGSDSSWTWIVGCIGKKFEAFDVVVTDVRPASGDYMLVAIGGKASHLGGGKHRHAGGLAPFNSKVISNAVVFGFSDGLRNRKRDICEVVGMEIGHAYGLDHGYHCRDLMTYLKYCGYKRFQDLDIPCGENKKRTCANGQPTQNSYRHLLKVLGPAKR